LTRDNRVSSGWSKLAFCARGVLIESAASIRITHATPFNQHRLAIGRDFLWRLVHMHDFAHDLDHALLFDDLRRDPLEVRKATLASIVAKASPGIRFNEHIEGDGPTVFAHACKLGLEGVVSKRKDSAYRSGRSPDWLKMKNANAPAVKREAEEEWSKRGRR